MAKKGINDTKGDDGDQDDHPSLTRDLDRSMIDSMDAAGIEGEEVNLQGDEPEDKDPKEGASDEDTRLSAEQRSEEGELDPEEKRRDENRRRRKEAKERQHRAKARDKVELNFLRNQNDVLERRLKNVEQRQGSTEVATIASKIEEEEARLAHATTLLGQAVAAQSAEDVSKLTDMRDRIRDRISGLKNVKVNHERAVEAADKDTTSSSEPEEMHPVAKANAMTFFKRHRNWYDPQGGDRDSMMVYALDNEVLAEGYDPKTREYWEELERRCADALPHHFKKSKPKAKGDDLDIDDDESHDDDSDVDDDDEESGTHRHQETRREARDYVKKNGSKGPRMATGGSSGNGAAGKFYVSPERKKALMDFGVWDDPVLRNKYIKRYAAYDRDAASSKR